MVALAALLASCAQATQIVLVVDSDLTLTRVDVQISSTHSTPTVATADFANPATPRMPLTLAIYPRASAEVDVFINVTGTLMNGTRITRDVRTRFVAGQSRMLRVLLAARCLNTTCAATQTCDETGCRDIAIAGDALPAWPGSPPGLGGMSACTAVDELCNGQDDDCDMHVDEGIDLATDMANCGTCGHACTTGTCTAGFCTGERVTHLATGGAHTCVTTMAGSVTCWGWNDQDQLGTELYEATPNFVQVVGLSSASTISAGALHTCAVDGMGRCMCFGDGAYGALGRGSLLDAALPASVAGTTAYRDVVAGVSSACAIAASGALDCWGANDHGQLGIGHTSAMLVTTPTPTGLTGVSAVALGFLHGCALMTDHSVQCWGDDGAGQLGGAMPTALGAPAAVPGVSDAIALAAGRDFTCVVRMGGGVSCWGGNDQGQLGNGTTMASPTPTTVMGLTDATQISAPSAGTHVCAVRMGGLVACWGGNASGQLGDATTMRRSQPVMVAGLTGAAAVAAGGIAPDGTGHTCALDTMGRVYCWGDNALGQLGTHDWMSRNMPTLVLGR